MKKIHIIQTLCLAAFLSVSATPAMPAAPNAADGDIPAIRKFDQATLEKLGVAIHEQDIRAALATDLLHAKKTKRQLEKEGMLGWIVEGDAPDMTVLFIKQGNLGLEAAYSVKFSEKRKPVLEVPASPALTGRQRALFEARKLASQNIKRPCSRTYNVVMLPDPEKDGLLVYALAATTVAGEVMMGGHYRFTISSDGKRLERADALSLSCLTMSKRPKDAPPDARIAAITVTTLVADKPQETHIYLSLLHKIPIYVMSPEHHMWEVAEGKMRRIN